MKTKSNTMKSLWIALLVLTTTLLSAQTEKKEQRIFDLPILDMTQGVNIHFISPEPIQFVEIPKETTQVVLSPMSSQPFTFTKLTMLLQRQGVMK